MTKFKKTSKIQEIKHDKHRRWLIWTPFIGFNYLFYFSSLNVGQSDVAQSSVQTYKYPQTGCSTYFVHCLHLRTELTAGKGAAPGVEQTAYTPPLQDHKFCLRRFEPQLGPFCVACPLCASGCSRHGPKACIGCRSEVDKELYMYRIKCFINI